MNIKSTLNYIKYSYYKCRYLRFILFFLTTINLKYILIYINKQELRPIVRIFM